MKLNPYNPKSKCPKCGGKTVRVHYRGPIEQDPLWDARTYKPVGKWPKHEYQHRTCDTCSYDWPESVLPRTTLNKHSEVL